MFNAFDDRPSAGRGPDGRQVLGKTAHSVQEGVATGLQLLQDAGPFLRLHIGSGMIREGQSGFTSQRGKALRITGFQRPSKKGKAPTPHGFSSANPWYLGR